MDRCSAPLQAQGTLSHNLANSDTPGFKEALANTEAFPIKGPGFASRVDALHVDAGFNRTPGSQHITGKPLDLSLADRHLAGRAVQRRQEAYTRAALSVTPERPAGDLQRPSGTG
jgi:flagellar basal-body rod protein FlgF